MSSEEVRQSGTHHLRLSHSGDLFRIIYKPLKRLINQPAFSPRRRTSSGCRALYTRMRLEEDLLIVIALEKGAATRTTP